MKKHIGLYVLTAILCVLMIPTYIGMGRSDLATPPREWHEACEWIKNTTPQDALFIAWWDYGYWINYLAEREAYIDPGQNYERVTYVAQIFLSYHDWWEDWWDRPVYLVIDSKTAYNFKRPISIWAGMDNITIDWEKTMVQRLYSGESVYGLHLVYDNNVKIWRVGE